MIDKVLVLGGILLWSVIVIENMVTWMIWYLFLDPTASTWIIALVSIFIGIAIWYWAKGMLSKKSEFEEDEYDF